MKFKQAINKRTQHHLRAIELIFFFLKKKTLIPCLVPVKDTEKL